MIRQTPRTQLIVRHLRATAPAGLSAHALAFLVDAPVPSIRRLLNSLMHQGAPVLRTGRVWAYNDSVAQANADAGLSADL